jgi:predicted dehydrogenase
VASKINPSKSLRWGILGAGAIAGEFSDGIAASSTGVVHAVASRSVAKAGRFAAAHQVSTWYGSYEDLLADPGVDIVYVATPHPMHAEWAINAARAGKHVLCEKPLTVSLGEAKTVMAAARESGVFLMEAFMYRAHPQTAILLDILKSGVIGEVRALSVSFGYRPATSWEAGRVTDADLGGGSILDVGCYAVSVARMVAAVALGEQAAEPDQIVGCARLGPQDHVDHIAMGVLSFPGGLLAQIGSSVTTPLDDAIRVFGSNGRVVVPRPSWLEEHRLAGTSVIEVESHGTTRVVEVVAEHGIFSYEADHVARSIGAEQSTLVPWADTLANMRTLDRWRQAVGLRYDFERTA